MIRYLVYVGAFVNLLGVLSYIKDTLKGKTQPNKVTWFMWSVAPLIATAAAFSQGVRLAALPVFISGFGPLLVFISSFFNPKSYWKLGSFDYICGIFSVLALILWAVTKDANVAIVFAILSDAAAGAPTLIKSWKYPETENAGPFISGLFSAATSFAAITAWSFSQVGFAVYLIIVNIALVTAIYSKRIFNRKPHEQRRA